ncbi:MAG: phosphatidylserine/phosphatidylglycerophosphate/cardiolipin synthase family protein, partial [Pseudobdellovibrionaceae bacterium]|nr:phosphatidylserine/phosphatidylglycerophosphate/cardiolipin synthase family protein [Pseudobdellovibrionaceae bacterium]
VWLWPQNRLHSKLLIVDGRSALTGGRNIGRNYMKPAPDHPPPGWGPRVYGLSSDYKYRDTDIFVTGPAVGTMQRSFMKNWLEFGDWEQTITDSAGFWPSLNPGTWVNKGDCLQQVYYGVRYYCKKNDQRLRAIHTPDEIAADAELFPALPTMGESLVRYLDSNAVRAGHIPDRPYLRKLQENGLDRPRVSDAELDPYRGLTNGERVYVTLIHNAQKSIRLTNSYFALSQPMRKALREAVERGVKLEIFTNSYQSNDEAILWDCSVPDFKNFLDLGAEIYEWMSQAGMLHAKSALFDDTIAIVSSFNFDNASFKSNMESLAVIRGATVMDSMKRVWDLDMENPMTRKMTPDTLQKDANSRGIKGYLARPICSKLGGDN